MKYDGATEESRDEFSDGQEADGGGPVGGSGVGKGSLEAENLANFRYFSAGLNQERVEPLPSDFETLDQNWTESPSE